MASGMARGAKERGEVIAFGDGVTVKWDHNSEAIFRDNPNVVRPDCRDVPANARWIHFYKGSRIYNRQDSANERWVWNYDFRPVPGEFFFSPEENSAIKSAPKDFILIEPNVAEKNSGPNKLWPLDRYQAVCEKLQRDGHEVAQFQYTSMRFGLRKITILPTKSFRQAISVLRRAKLVICSEGGLHHGAAAVGKAAVVLFGGFIPPRVTGYDFHENISYGTACGKYIRCQHCIDVMQKITVEEVYEAASKALNRAAVAA